MRKLLFLCAVLLVTACHRDRVVITGQISHAEKTVLYLDEVDVYASRPADSIVLKKNGKFRFTIDTRVPCFYQLRLAPGKIIILFPKPGEHLKVSTDARDLMPSLSIEGSHDTEQVTKLIRALEETRVQLDSLQQQYNLATDDSRKEQLNKAYQDVLDSHRKFSITFILTHYNSLASLYALYQQYQPGFYVFYKYQDIQFFKIVSDSLGKYVPGSKHVTALKAHTNNLISDYKSQVILQKAEDAEASLPEVALPNMDGDTITLASLRGKYVLLCFWISENRVSVDQNLALKKIYERFRSRGFEIYQVSFDRSPVAWKDAVRFDELPWISVIDSRFPNSPVAAGYNVTQIPSNYLIGRDNLSILAKNLTPDQLQLKLTDLLN
jgi:peroxiredoxin